MRKGLLFPLMLLSTLLLLPGRVLACACCTEPGEYRISFSKPSEYEIGVLQRIRFGSTAHLFTTVADLEEDGRGLLDPSESYSLTGSLIGRLWKLNFRDGNKNGTLSFSLPAKLLSYRVDIQPTAGSIDPKLYKEWRLEGRVNGTGLFRAGIVGPTKYFLVFQGRGNNCDDETDFTHWRLEITGKRARYAFYGELATSNKQSKAE
jgi:hypothetical protein